MRVARMLLYGRVAGTLTELESGGSTFAYTSEWLAAPDAEPISLTLPLPADPWVSRSVHPFFETLLPEGWLLDLSTTRLKVAKDDVFGLLLVLCRNCIGAVSIQPAP